MSEQILDKVRDALDGPIDFEGQRLAESLTNWMLSITGLIALVTGYATQDIHWSLWTGLAGSILTFLAIVPPWPFFNKNPPRWLPARAGLSNISINVDGVPIR